MVVRCGSGNAAAVDCFLLGQEGVDFPSMALFCRITMHTNPTIDLWQAAGARALC
jgi:hypothetical protein